MKKFLTLTMTLLSMHLSAQYLPNNSQVFQFSPILNPGFSGIESYNDLKLGYRYQWTGYGENAPKFINLSYNVRLKQPLDMSYNSLRISNTSALRQNGIPRLKRVIHGLAGHVFQSEIGAIESIGGGLTYAFHFPIVNQVRVSFGASAFIENRKLDMTEVAVRDADNDPFYNHLLNSSTSQTDLNARAGILFYSPHFYFGGSYLPLFYKAIQSSELAFDEAFYTATGQIGFAIPVNPQFAVKPSGIAYLLLDNSIEFDASVKAYIQNKVWAGVTYRSVESGIAMLGFNFNDKFQASYSYEVSLGDFQQFSGGSHELVLGMRLKNLKKQQQYTW
jgi:type IX secretion system PorP/SprF family membrane protein